jgi:hypothetical protein
MFRRTTIASVLGAAALGCAAFGAVSSPARYAPPTPKFSNPTNISNPYLPITSFRKCVLAGRDGSQHLRVTRTLLPATQAFTYAGQSFQAVKVLDRVVDLKSSQRIERTIDYFAQSDAGDVYYLGEDVNDYKDGKFVGHEGQWRLGRDTHVPGILMSAHPAVGQAFDSENVPGIVHETSTVVAAGQVRKAAGHYYSNVLTIREDATPPPEVEYKNYAPGMGVITEANGGIRLLRCR